MKLILAGLVGFAIGAGAQLVLPEVKAFPKPVIEVRIDDQNSPAEFRTVIFVDPNSKAIPQNFVQIGTFEINCMTPDKRCKLPLKVYKIQ